MNAPVTDKIKALFWAHKLDPTECPLLVTALMGYVYDYANEQVEQALAYRPVYRLCTSFDTVAGEPDNRHHDAA
mgnify:FL=1